jgi:predicted deacylase
MTLQNPFSVPALPFTVSHFPFVTQAAICGVVAWSVRPGAIVRNGQLLGEIVNIENPDSERTPVLSHTNGILFSMARSKLVRPGQVIAKVAGNTVLGWRTGNLLTS